MDDLRSFSAGLRLTLKHMVGATDTAPYRSHRPFVSKGSPLDCRVFIVGFNPARSNVGFGEFWDDNYGFRYDLWHSAYLANNGNRLSPTRQRLERVVQAANSVHILETNLYSFPTPRASDLRMPNRQSDCLSFLVETLKPKLIITHGAKGVEGPKLGEAETITRTFTWNQANNRPIPPFYESRRTTMDRTTA